MSFFYYHRTLPKLSYKENLIFFEFIVRYEVCCAFENLPYVPAKEGVVGERDLLTVGTHDAGEHVVALPIVTSAHAESTETDAQFGFEPLLIDRGDNATAQRHFFEY